MLKRVFPDLKLPDFRSPRQKLHDLAKEKNLIVFVGHERGGVGALWVRKPFDREHLDDTTVVFEKFTGTHPPRETYVYALRKLSARKEL